MTSATARKEKSGWVMTHRQREIGAFIIRFLIGLIFIVPLFFTFSYSLRPDSELVNKSQSLLPEMWTLEHYEWVFKYVPVFRYMANSLIMCAIVICSKLITASLASYAFAFYQFKGSKFLFLIVTSATIIPGEVTLISNFLTVSQAGLRDTYIGLVAPFLVGTMSIFMMRQFYMSLDHGYREAAKIDGCGNFGFLFRIAIPLSVPTMASVAIYEFINIYNLYMWPLMISKSQEMYTIQVGMSMLVGQESDEPGNILAGAILCMIPATILFVIGQKRLISGMVAGGMKG